MIRISAHPTGIQQGSRMMFSDFQTQGPMWTGSGTRELRQLVSFDTAFAAKPAVMVSISLWDADRKANLRADLSAEAITETSFELVFRTWGDTKLARLRADWLAIGPLPDEDAWQLD